MFIFGQINVQSSTTITHTLTAIGAYWELDEGGFPISNNSDLEEASAIITGSTTTEPSFLDPGEWYGFLFPWTPNPYQYTDEIAYGFYKVTNSYSNDYFYIDIRDCKYRGICAGSYNPDFFIKFYDNEDIFKWKSPTGDWTSISNGEVLRVWEIKNNGITPTTSNFENFWSNALVQTRSSDNHPRIVWGPYQENGITVQQYKVYRKYGSSAWQQFATVSSTTYQYLDESVYLTIPGGQAGTDVQYKVTAVYNTNSETSPTNIVTVNVQGEQIEKKGNSFINIESYILDQNYPNPFNPSTKISYSIKEEGLVTLKVYDVLGKEIAILVNENKAAGIYEAEFNASQLPSGMYIYKIQAGSFSDVKKMLLTK